MELGATIVHAALDHEDELQRALDRRDGRGDPASMPSRLCGRLDRPIMTVDDRLLDLSHDLMQRRRKVEPPGIPGGSIC